MNSTYKLMSLFVVFMVASMAYYFYSPKELSESDEEYLINFIDEYDVQLQLRDELMGKIKRDELWDAEKIEVLEEIKDTSFEYNFDNNQNARPYRFDDGSFIITNTRVKETYLLDGSDNAKRVFSRYYSSEEMIEFYYDKGSINVMEVEMVLGLSIVKFEVTYGIYDGAWIGEMIFDIDNVSVTGFGTIKDIEYGIIRSEEDVVENRFAQAYITWQYNRLVKRNNVDITGHVIFGIGEDYFYIAPKFIN